MRLEGCKLSTVFQCIRVATFLCVNNVCLHQCTYTETHGLAIPMGVSVWPFAAICVAPLASHPESSSSSSSSFFSRVGKMPVDRSSCVDKLSWCLDGCLLDIFSCFPFHTVSVVGTESVKTSLETIHCWFHSITNSSQFYHSVAEEVLP